MRALVVVVLNETVHDALEVTRPEDQQPVETLRSHGSDEALGVCIGDRRQLHLMRMVSGELSG
jgi:hypothetical protein